MVSVFKYAKDNKLMDEASYPYTKRYSGTCKYRTSKGILNVRGYVKPKATVSDLMAAVALGPVSVGISASKPVM